MQDFSSNVFMKSSAACRWLRALTFVTQGRVSSGGSSHGAGTSSPPQRVSLMDQYTKKENSIWHNQVISPAASAVGELMHLAAVGQTAPQLSGCSRRCRAPRLPLTLRRSFDLPLQLGASQNTYFEIPFMLFPETCSFPC